MLSRLSGIHFSEITFHEFYRVNISFETPTCPNRIADMSCEANSTSNGSEYTFEARSSKELPTLADLADLIDDDINVTMRESENCLVEIIPNELLVSFNEIINESDEPEMKTITMEEYRRLVLLIPENEKLKNTINRMQNVIKRKDILLANRSPSRQFTTVSKLSFY